MVHGFPRTSLMWRFLAPKLAGNHTVICVDLRAYGRSGIPASLEIGRFQEVIRSGSMDQAATVQRVSEASGCF
jgi:pimeloyl-ACP methyl ester carboxylesterase